MSRLIPTYVLTACLVLLPFLGTVTHADEIKPTPKVAQTKTAYKLVTIADGMSHPWALAFLPDGNMLITERPGRVRLVKDGKLVDKALSGAPKALSLGQGGMLDILLHPKFEENRLVYFSYASGERRDTRLSVARARLKEDLSGFENLQVIFNANQGKRGGRHYGCRMIFLPDGTLLFSVGDGGMQEKAQDPKNHFGTMIRLNDDGTVPKDNPFVGKAGYDAKIYSYGHRNPQGLAFDPDTKTIWSTEHGARGGDELNIVKKGENYGWPIVTYSINYSGSKISDKRTMPGMTDPLVVWTPVLAACGLAYYNGDKFPMWKGDLFAGALRLNEVRRIDLKDGEPVFQDSIPIGDRVRDVRQGPQGYLWVLTDSRNNGRLIRIEPGK